MLQGIPDAQDEPIGGGGGGGAPTRPAADASESNVSMASNPSSESSVSQQGKIVLDLKINVRRSKMIHFIVTFSIRDIDFGFNSIN